MQYTQSKVKSADDFERRLETAGYGVGLRLLEYLSARDRLHRRETRVVNMLQFLCDVVWKFLFNKAADGLERSVDAEDEYMVRRRHPLLSTPVPSLFSELP